MNIDKDAHSAVIKSVLSDYGPSIRHASSLEDLHTVASHIHSVWGDIPGRLWGQKYIDREIVKRRRQLVQSEVNTLRPMR